VKKIIKLITITIVAILLLDSCEALSGKIPNGLLSKTNSASDNSQAQNRVDPSLAISGTGDSYSSKGSVHDETSTSTDNNNDNETGNGAKSLIGADDNSINNNESNSLTRNSSDNNSYHGSVINNNDSTFWFYLCLILIITNIVGWVLPTPQDMFRSKK